MHVKKPRLTLIFGAMTTVVVLALSAGAFTQARSAGLHPVTGETLADNQTFTYRLRDRFLTRTSSPVDSVSASASRVRSSSGRSW